jgi:uncharacterized Fe-S cluster-containing radical SAM superfamily protein
MEMPDSFLRNALALRSQVLNLDRRSVRLASLLDSQQQSDISKPIILNGYARLHRFSEEKKANWITDPLPTVPASSRLHCNPSCIRDARVLQLSACNLRCWYCFVDYANLSPASPSSKEFSITEIISALQSFSNDPYVLDLSGGNPGLAPEWILWVIEELTVRNLDNVYVWADDNLTVNFYTRFLSYDQIHTISLFPRFGSVACFKGFDATSFEFNTGLPEPFFDEQFNVFKSLLSYGWDIYGYVTLTTPTNQNLQDKIFRFFNRLQDIDPILPLRVIPLEIRPYTPTKSRMKRDQEESMANQYKALDFWACELKARYPSSLLNLNITDIHYGAGG